MQSNGCSENKGRREPKEVVQGRVDRCAVGKALRTTTGRKARYALLQTIKACKLKNPCYCGRAYFRTKEKENSGEEETRTTSGETETSQTS